MTLWRAAGYSPRERDRERERETQVAEDEAKRILEAEDRHC